MERLSERLLSWASLIDEKTLDQAHTTARMPFIHPHLALMPDAHLGKGATVGSVIPTLGAIIPAAVGVDIGCGMIAVRTQFTRSHLDGRDLAELREQIERAIPLSAGRYNRKIVATAEPRIAELEDLAAKHEFDPETYAGNWRLQLGTLGSGNHFIEVSADELDRVWLFLHSGSRGVGNKIAGHHIAVAQRLAKQWWIDLPDPDLAYLVEGTPEFTRYIRELRWAQHFALLNREEMMDRVIRQVSEFLGSADVFAAPHSLGRHAGNVYRHLLELPREVPLTIDDAGTVVQDLTTVMRALALHLDVDGYLETRAVRYRYERERWDQWLNQVTWIHKSDSHGRRRPARPDSTAVPLFESATIRGRDPKYPREPDGSWDHSAALHLIAARHAA
ncbi:RtcB family protein [Microbacterium croceum]|uniref:RtcB family protein n=1 Tax=Microbacterium croceum TaxID=2851645 RepID=UPI001FFD9FEA|nr:RtcB family protein [Microbacterium croceum]